MLSKISKSTWLMLIGGIVIIAGVILGMNLSQQSKQKREVEASLSQAQTKLASIKFDDLNTQLEKLTQDINQLSAQNRDSASSLAYPRDSIDTTDAFLSDASHFNVDILNMGSSAKTTANLSGIKCAARNISFTAQGTLSNIAGFLYSLSATFPTSILNTVTISRDVPDLTLDPVSNGTSGSPEDTKLDIDFTIYNYEGE